MKQQTRKAGSRNPFVESSIAPIGAVVKRFVGIGWWRISGGIAKGSQGRIDSVGVILTWIDRIVNRFVESVGDGFSGGISKDRGTG